MLIATVLQLPHHHLTKTTIAKSWLGPQLPGNQKTRKNTKKNSKRNKKYSDRDLSSDDESVAIVAGLKNDADYENPEETENQTDKDKLDGIKKLLIKIQQSLLVPITPRN
jgi:hypothetical protein